MLINPQVKQRPVADSMNLAYLVVDHVLSPVLTRVLRHVKVPCSSCSVWQDSWSSFNSFFPAFDSYCMITLVVYDGHL